MLARGNKDVKCSASLILLLLKNIKDLGAGREYPRIMRHSQKYHHCESAANCRGAALHRSPGSAHNRLAMTIGGVS
jgi:hypothetical protein